MIRKIFLAAFFTFSVVCALAQERLILLKTPTADLEGTISVPETSRPVPLVLIVAGSGPTDRNCNNEGMQSNAYKYLADSLLAHGIASVRYDKRGVGQSDMGMGAGSDLTIGVYAEDVRLWIEHLALDRRFSKIIVAGHSEGALLGMLAIQKTRKAHAFISVAGAGRPVDIVLKEQLASVHETARTAMYDIIDRLKRGDTVGNIPPIYYSLFHPSLQPFLISWMKIDPASEMSRLKVPVLIVQGSTDIQVKENDALNLKKAKPDAELKIIGNMSHVLKKCESLDRKEQIAHYNDTAAPLHPEFVSAITAFIQGL